MDQKLQQSLGNHVLDSLPEAELGRLQPFLSQVAMQQSSIVYNPRSEIDYVYFPLTCLLSWVVTTLEGEMIEAGITGYEGMLGTQVLMGESLSAYRVEVELAGVALRMRADDFRKESAALPSLHRILLRYIYTQITQLTQSVGCNRFHTVEERLCRWLLVAHDRAKSDELQLTQEIVANMIGARRPAVNIVTGTLQSAGLIKGRRGRIIIIDRQGLEDSACECYRIVKEEMDRFMSIKF
ncbi:MAG TPA: Crp/Fnr family transcriptional regulator [Blastocatellia bacterium]|jgi:CRP-like cAMP-binding protein|nr:Crp/Fnr family transcriptional regulator [Blastocatellia bacterium]